MHAFAICNNAKAKYDRVVTFGHCLRTPSAMDNYAKAKYDPVVTVGHDLLMQRWGTGK